MCRFIKRMFLINKFVVCIAVTTGLFMQTAVAREGDCGYEGGISSGEAPNKNSYDYQEVCFITGEPLVFKGTVSIRKISRKDTKTQQEIITSTYTYDLKNADRSATLKRTLVYSTRVTKTGNGQLIEETAFARAPSETLRIGNQAYNLVNFDFTRTRITDLHPAVHYHAGNFWGRKTYQTGTGMAAGSGSITVDITGEFYGYDHYWGSAEVQTLNYYIEAEQKKGGTLDRWGGTATVRLSSTTVKDLQYVKNQPDHISFQGGYLQVQNNNSILEYESHLPEFDSDGISTGHVIDRNGSLMLESFPVQTRLQVPLLDRLKGHPQEKEISLMFSLGIFDDEEGFKPEQYLTRAEFAAAIIQAAKEVPPDPALSNKYTGEVKQKKQEPVSPFKDVDVDSSYYEAVKTAFERGIMTGDGTGNFKPDEYITIAEAITVMIRAIGLESLAPGPGAVTLFKDNDRIPYYARKAAWVSERIGLIADINGYLHPENRITKAEAAVILGRFINYLRNDLRKDYRDRMVNY